MAFMKELHSGMETERLTCIHVHVYKVLTSLVAINERSHVHGIVMVVWG